MVKIEFLGAMNSIGSSGILVDTDGTRVVLDYGTTIQDERLPMYPFLVKGKIDGILLSHAHLDHSGGLALLTKRNPAPIYAPKVSRPMVELLLHDSLKIARHQNVLLPFDKNDVKKCIGNFRTVGYKKPIAIGKKNPIKYTSFDAGHIPGSTMPYLEANGKKILYTGDFNTADTQLLKGADTDLPEIDVLITECTYAERDHPNRKQEERKLVGRIRRTLANGGNAVVACFAIGRTQEMLLILEEHGIDYQIYMDGMAKKATTIINSCPEFMGEPERLGKALRNVTYVNNRNQRERVTNSPCVILTTSGMLNGGPVVHYLDKLRNDDKSSLTMTGYQVETSGGHWLLQTGRFVHEEHDFKLKMNYKKLDFSSHTGREDLLEFIEKVNPKKVLCVHGDNTVKFAEELCAKGFDAEAPVENNRVFEV